LSQLDREAKCNMLIEINIPMSFLKEHLMMTDYNWGDTSGYYHGEPARRVFNRKNGFQVLFLINCCSAFLENFTIKEGREIEDRIGRQLPEEVKSEISVFRWLRSGFFNEWLTDMK
jgi:hypothetical protein